ncbi:uncharacterized protein [Porites lutea]|uniref:uncharacterized protein isoform X4 n=1 Tax=Porites lutea TaxID=51062 RepID=UPI003CC540C3
MEHSSLDLSIVKKEPGFGEPFSPESGLFDNMMSEDFHDTTFHSMHQANEDVPVDWLSGFFDEVPTCAETLSYNSLPEYTSSSLPYTSLGKSHYLSLNGLSMDTMPSFPEECSNESLYCSTPSDSTPDYKPLSPESTHSLEADVKPNLFSKDVLLEPHESFSPSMNHRLEPPDLQLFEQTDGPKSSPESPHSENGSDRLDSESGYDSASHSPPSSSNTPPHILEDNDMSVSSVRETTPPVIQVEERALKKVRRKIKNKISAQESRRKKKEYMETLEKRVENCASENLDLRKKVDTLETTNRSLISQLQKLQSLIAAKVPRAVTARSTQTSTCLMVVVLCFAVFLGSWSPLSSTGINLPSLSASSSKGAVDYSTPSVRSRVLLSVVDDLDSDEFIEPFPANNMFDPVDQLMPSMPTKNMAAENQTKNIISMETVAMEHRTNESQLVASAA